MNRIGHLVGGKPVGDFLRVGPVFDPATGQQTGEVALASVAEVDAAVTAAAEAFPAWSAMSLGRRSEILIRFRHLLSERRADLAEVITAEHGKTLADALGEVGRTLESVDLAVGAPPLLKGDYSSQVGTGIDVYEKRLPVGVGVGISPFNFTLLTPLMMVIHAIAAGNTFVLKPSEQDPSAPLLWAEWLHEAGLPPGVLNVVQGDRVAVDRLLEHPHVSAVSFVGSTPVARHVYEYGAAHGKRVQAFGGAKNHMVVLPDADIGVAADAAVSAAYGATGQRCMAVSVVVAVGTIGDELVEAIAERAAKVRTAPGTEPGAEMGPLVSAAARDRSAAYVDSARDEGATVVLDGRDADLPSEGFFMGPSLIDHVTADMAVYQNEVFGPVLVVVRVADYDAAIALVNANPYGNGTAIFTRDGGAARRYESDVQAGTVGINVPLPVPVGYHSFSGWKGSAFGDTHVYGPRAFNFWTRSKVITSRWPDPSTSSVDLGFPQHD